MKLLPLALVLVTAMFGGRLIGLGWAGSDDGAGGQAPSAAEREEFQALATDEARRQIDDYFARRRDRLQEETTGLDRARAEALADARTRVETLRGILERSEDAFGTLSSTLAEDRSPGELVVAWATNRVLADDLAMGRTLITGREEETRREGLRHLAKAAAAGNREAIELLMGLFGDPEPGIAQEALRLAAGLARRDDPETRKLIADSGLESRLVAMLPGLEGMAQRRVLEALTAQGNAAATTVWRQIYNDDTARGRDQVSAARALKELGSPGEYDQLLLQLEYDLAADDRRTFRSALNDIRRLGGDDAKAALQRALDAAPEGRDADSLRRAIENFDVEERRGGGRFGDFGPPDPGSFFGGGASDRRVRRQN
ncbi:MAG: hypothetical protein H6807_14135 [Planctomycetes bacterium]|nr:hypothetical protein [Planctomycetota bacterium]